MVKGYYSTVARELHQLGFELIGNAKGSHEKWRNQVGRTLIVPRHLLSRHTANAILKDAGSALKVLRQTQWLNASAWAGCASTAG